MGLVEGKAAIVTGGASGIGAAAAAVLAREGAKVLITDVDAARGREVAARIVAEGGIAQFREHDVTDEESWPGIVAAAVEAYGGLHIMVANAGIGAGGPIVETSLAAWRRIMAINLDGVFLSVKSAIPAMSQSGGGSIVITSSIAGLSGAPFLSAYCATKGGVRLFAKAAALECAALGTRIRVNSIHPGIIDTPIWSKLPSPGGPNAPIDPNELAHIAAPIGRAGQPGDIANGILYLASDLSSYVTGSELVIDGGMTATSGLRRP